MRTLCISYARLYHGVLYICLFFRRSQLQLRSRTQRNFAAWLVGPWTPLQPSADAPRPPHSPADCWEAGSGHSVEMHSNAWKGEKPSFWNTAPKVIAKCIKMYQNVSKCIKMHQNLIKKPHQYDNIIQPLGVAPCKLSTHSDRSFQAWRFSVQVEYTKKPPGPRRLLSSSTPMSHWAEYPLVICMVNQRKTMRKPWENHGKMEVYPLVMSK